MKVRLKTDLWIGAERKRLEVNGLYCFLVKRGDDDRGVVLEKVVLPECKAILFERTFDYDGNSAWRALGSGAPESEHEVDQRITRQISLDPDAWVLEVEDPKQQFTLDAPLLPY